MAAKQPARKRIPPEIEKGVLTRSRRRCALCFHLDRDTRQKYGQIAHLDRRRANSNEDNLAFLCLPHHSEYDSTASQHKNYTIGEVKTARKALDRWVRRGMPALRSTARSKGSTRSHKKKSIAVDSVRTEILEAFFQRGQFTGSEIVDGRQIKVGDLWITLYVRVTNITSPEDIALVDCALEIESLGRTHRLNAERTVVPSPTFIERPTAYHTVESGLTARHQLEMIEVLDSPVVLKRGIPRGGLVQFLIRNLEEGRDDRFQDSGVFTLTFVDGLGHAHQVKREAEVWAKAGKLVARPPIWLPKPTQQHHTQSSVRPILQYCGVDGQPWFLFQNLGGSGNPQLINIRNIENDIPITAHNVRAKIEYTHADGEHFVVREGIWLENAGVAVFVNKVDIKSGKTARLCIAVEQREGPFVVIEDTITKSSTKTLKPGKWTLNIALSMDNGAEYHAKGGFHISEENRIDYRKPTAFTLRDVGSR